MWNTRNIQRCSRIEASDSIIIVIQVFGAYRWSKPIGDRSSAEADLFIRPQMALRIRGDRKWNGSGSRCYRKSTLPTLATRSIAGTLLRRSLSLTKVNYVVFLIHLSRILRNSKPYSRNTEPGSKSGSAHEKWLKFSASSARSTSSSLERKTVSGTSGNYQRQTTSIAVSPIFRQTVETLVSSVVRKIRKIEKLEEFAPEGVEQFINTYTYRFTNNKRTFKPFGIFIAKRRIFKNLLQRHRYATVFAKID